MNKEKWFTWFCLSVALNYQTEGRMMQLNRAKFMVNGGIGYVLKPPPMCKGNEQTAQVKSQTRVHSTSSFNIPVLSLNWFYCSFKPKRQVKNKQTNKKTLERLCKAEINPNFSLKEKRSYHCVIYCRFFPSARHFGPIACLLRNISICELFKYHTWETKTSHNCDISCIVSSF